MKEIEFLLEYAKIGVLYKMKNLDSIESEELKQRFIEIKKSFENNEVIIGGLPPRPGKDVKKDKMTAVKRWASGIGARQKAYEEKHKGEL